MANKYLTNFALDFACGDFLFLSPNTLYETLPDISMSIANKCHIYMVVETPKVSIDPSSLKFKVFDNKIFYAFDLVYLMNGLRKLIHIGTQDKDDYLDLSDNEIGMQVSDYPHTSLELINSSGEVLRSIGADTIASLFQFDDLISLKVLYVGKAYGKDGSRNALDRLKKHEKLQEILAQYVNKPDKSILIGMFEFAPARMIINFNGTSDINYTEEEEERYLNAFDGDIPMQDQISIIEASIIRYFEPEYNIQLKENLPSKKSKILLKCYEYDFSAVGVTISSKGDLFPFPTFNLYSNNIFKNYFHQIMIDLHSPEERKQFFMIGDNVIVSGLIRHNEK